MNKIIKENYPVIVVLLILVFLMGITFILLSNNKELDSDQVLQGRSGGTGQSIESIIEVTTGSYDALALVSGPLFLEKVVIGNSITEGGILIDNSITTHSDGTLVAELYNAPVGTIEIGAYLDIGLLITTSQGLNASFIFEKF